MKPLSELTTPEVNKMVKLPVPQRCMRIFDKFDEWLAIRVLRLKLAHEDLPQLNSAFAEYFADMRTAPSSEVRP